MRLSQRRLNIFLAAIGMLILILDFKTAAQGASSGLELCFRTVIPSLFPFFVLSGFITGSLLGTKIPLLGSAARLCGIPKGAESLLMVGLLGGYPVGAQCIAQAYRSGQLSKQDASRMLGFCSNAGPSFLFGMAGILFPGGLYAWMLFGIQIVSSMITGILLPGKQHGTATCVKVSPIRLTGAMQNAILSMAGVCGWIVLFRVILTFCERWFLWLLPASGQVLFKGFFELSNGIIALSGISSVPLRFILCSAMLSLGGICVAMQTQSVTAGLGLGAYLPGKLVQGCISTLLSTVTTFMIHTQNIGFLIISLALSVIFTVFCLIKQRKNENNSSIHKILRV